MPNKKFRHAFRRLLATIIFAPVLMPFLGCQVEYAGQTLPSPYYLSDDIQYYVPGPEFKLAREAAALQEQAAAIESQRQEAAGF